MRKRLFGSLLVLASAALAVACADSDAAITSKIKSEISTDRTITNGSRIDVTTQKKVVTLSGTAESPAAKERAVALARGVGGVKDVVDNLTAAPAQTAAPPSTGAPSAGAPDDAAITAAIQSKLLQDQRVAKSKIDVETRQGIVTLSGTVPNEQARQDAVKIAQDTAGVQRVEDQLRVEG